MIFIKSTVSIIENSGVRNVNIIQLLNIKSQTKLLTQFVLVTLKKVTKRCKLKRKNIFTCLILTVAFWKKSDTSGILLKSTKLCGSVFDARASETKRNTFYKYPIS